MSWFQSLFLRIGVSPWAREINFLLILSIVCGSIAGLVFLIVYIFQILLGSSSEGVMTVGAVVVQIIGSIVPTVGYVLGQLFALFCNCGTLLSVCFLLCIARHDRIFCHCLADLISFLLFRLCVFFQRIFLNTMSSSPRRSRMVSVLAFRSANQT
jgi:hypothetical protein